MANKEESWCGRCGRILTAQASIEVGYGKRCFEILKEQTLESPGRWFYVAPRQLLLVNKDGTLIEEDFSG